MDRPTPFTKRELADAAEPLFAESRTVRFQDVDAAGIIFFAKVPEYFHDATVGMLARAGYDLAKALALETWGMPLVHAEADYLRPMRFGDAIDVEVVGVRLGAHSTILGFRVRLGGRVAAVGQNIHAFIDRKTFSPLANPEEAKAIFGPLAARTRVG